jgi:hypothetical protein
VPSPIGVADLSAAASSSFSSLYLSPRTVMAQAIRNLVGERDILAPIAFLGACF